MSQRQMPIGTSLQLRKHQASTAAGPLQPVTPAQSCNLVAAVANSTHLPPKVQTLLNTSNLPAQQTRVLTERAGAKRGQEPSAKQGPKLHVAERGGRGREGTLRQARSKAAYGRARRKGQRRNPQASKVQSYMWQREAEGTEKPSGTSKQGPKLH